MFKKGLWALGILTMVDITATTNDDIGLYQACLVTCSNENYSNTITSLPSNSIDKQQSDDYNNCVATWCKSIQPK